MRPRVARPVPAIGAEDTTMRDITFLPMHGRPHVRAATALTRKQQAIIEAVAEASRPARLPIPWTEAVWRACGVLGINTFAFADALRLDPITRIRVFNTWRSVSMESIVARIDSGDETAPNGLPYGLLGVAPDAGYVSRVQHVDAARGTGGVARVIENGDAREAAGLCRCGAEMAPLRARCVRCLRLRSQGEVARRRRFERKRAAGMLEMPHRDFGTLWMKAMRSLARRAFWHYSTRPVLEDGEYGRHLEHGHPAILYARLTETAFQWRIEYHRGEKPVDMVSSWWCSPVDACVLPWTH